MGNAALGDCGAAPVRHTTFRASTWFLARPGFIAIVTIGTIGWIAYNTLASVFSYTAFDPAPFNGLCMAFSLASFYMVILIYATQQRDDELAELREQLLTRPSNK